MLVFKTSPYLIIGLKSYHQIIRLVKENHFKKVVICYINDKPPHNVLRLTNKIKSTCNVVLQHLNTNKKNIIPSKIDLIISFGSQALHNTVKILNKAKVPLYCIETEPARISSYEAYVFNAKIKTKVIPDLIFNDCCTNDNWNSSDLIYFMRGVVLALNAILMNKDNDDFVYDCALQGILSVIQCYKKLKTASRKQLRQIYIDLAYADVLMKNAYNNLELTFNIAKMSLNNQDHHKFAMTICDETLNIINNKLKPDNLSLMSFLLEQKISLEQFKNDIKDIYNDLIDFYKHKTKTKGGK